MFKWLTRNDGARVGRAKRRLKSSRASVFSEFALVMPIVVMVCSALIEIVGFWDAQIMANHAAWTVGRIAMVRGSDGLAFSEDLAKKTKTGIKGEGYPDSVKKLIDDVNGVISGFGKFNDRGNIATMMLMSTCGIGYYGSSPGKAISGVVGKLCDDGVNAVVKGLPEWVGASVTNLPSIKMPDFIGGGNFGVGTLINDLVGKIVNEIAQAVLKPIAEAIGGLLTSACEAIIGKDGVKLDDLFSRDTDAARHARQICGAAARIVCAKDTIKKEVVTVEDMTNTTGHFMFSKSSKNKRLVYPQVADDEASCDGFFVTGAHGWPALDEGHAMVHVEINWPYESGWLFPVVSGRADPSTENPPAATGHSMVFPQPNIANENLYSEGAKAFDPGEYSQNAGTEALDELAKQIEKYLKLVRFGMLYRIREDEALSFASGNYSAGTVTWYKYCKPLAEYFGVNTKDLPARGDYGDCWNAITDNNDKNQNATERYLNKQGYFNPGSYKYRNYFKWEGTWHGRYSSATRLCDWYERRSQSRHSDNSYGLTYQDGDVNVYSTGDRKMEFELGRIVYRDDFDKVYEKYESQLKVKKETLRDLLSGFANRSGVNVAHIATWQGHPDWAEKDESLYNKDKTAVSSYSALMSFIRKEAQEVKDILDGNGKYRGENGEPVLEPEDEEAIKDPAAAAKKAEAKWYTQKDKLKWKLQEIDGAIKDISTAASQYSSAITTFKSDRKKCVSAYFIEGCIKLLIDNGNDTAIFSGSSLPFTGDAILYDIDNDTDRMIALVDEYQAKLQAAYEREIEYGKLLGLDAAGGAERSGKTLDQVVDSAGDIGGDTPGTLSDGPDTGAIIDHDRQEFSGGEWKWRQ